MNKTIVKVFRDYGGGVEDAVRKWQNKNRMYDAVSANFDDSHGYITTTVVFVKRPGRKTSSTTKEENE